MIKINLLLVLLFSPILGFNQCDPNMIWSNTSTNAVCEEQIGAARYIYANGLADHTTGVFPNSGNPHSISSQQYEYTVCAYPILHDSTTAIWSNMDPQPGQCPDRWEFGVAVNGVKMDPAAAEFFVDNNGQNNLDWQLEAVGSNLGLDFNDAHVQPNGAYHYHGVADGLHDLLGIDGTSHSPLVGWSADGFPIYYEYIYSDPNDANSAVLGASSCWQLKSGNRPGDGMSAPDGPYDGTYAQDYEFVNTGGCILDECNGRWGITPEFPNGVYHYVVTDGFPYIPRCFKGRPDGTFRLGPSFCTVSEVSLCSQGLGVNGLTFDDIELTVYPSPADDFLNIDLSGAENHEALITVIGQNGHVLIEKAGWLERLDISKLNTGQYFLQVDIEGRQIAHKFMKN